MLTRPLLLLPLLLASTTLLKAQAKYTATRTADLQIGVSASSVTSDYDTQRFIGGGGYITYDFKPHFGAEFDLHQANSRQSDSVYERSYEFGLRYFRTYGIVVPYAKIMYGRGVFNFPNGVANLAYNMFTGGGGADFKLRPWLNVRADFEYQDWLSFPPNGLSPTVISVGVAYHFPGGLKRGSHY